MGPESLIGAGVGILGGIGSLFAAKKNNKALDKLVGQDPKYTANPIAADRLAFARTLLNARMPGATQQEKNIYAAQANQMGNVSQNATDSSQMLALGAASQGQTNNAFQNMGMAESQDYQRRYGNLVGAQEGQINEQDKVYQDKIRNFEDLVKIRGAQAQNRSQAWNSISNAGFGAMNLGMAGGFNNMGGIKSPFGGGISGNSWVGLTGGPQISMPSGMQNQLGDASMNANFYQDK